MPKAFTDPPFFEQIGSTDHRDLTKSDIEDLVEAGPRGLLEALKTAQETGNEFVLGMITAAALQGYYNSQHEATRAKQAEKGFFKKNTDAIAEHQNRSVGYLAIFMMLTSTPRVE